MFDIGDCENTTMIIMDHCEQTQIDHCKRNCRIFVGACASSIFIRNCEDCTFYVCTKQLRLRDCVRCKFYIMSVSEVHIEYSNAVSFAPFNGGYPEHAQHLSEARLDISHNLWYDIFDHNDQAKTHVNWSLIPESEYEEIWFPAGKCEVAVPITKPGSVVRFFEEESMQTFGANQLVADATSILPPFNANLIPDLKPTAITTAPIDTIPPLPPINIIPISHLSIDNESDEFQVKNVINSFINYVPGAASDVCLCVHIRLIFL